MTRSFGRTVRLATIMLASAILFACDGSTGPAGPAGPPGAAGPSGTPGTPGTPGPTTGTALAWDTPDRINVEILAVTIPDGGGAPTVTLRLSDDLGFGLRDLPASTISFALAQLSPPPAVGSSSEWRSYITSSRTDPPDVQASTEGATSGTFTDNGDGTYEYTFANALTAYPAGPLYDANATHRLGVEIRTNRVIADNIPANNAPYDFVPAGGSPTFTRLIVNNATCNACHDNLEIHGEARFDVEYCVTCHNPYSIDPDTAAEPWSGTVDMKQMVHKIHFGAKLTNGYTIIGYGGFPHPYDGVEFTQDVRNCTTCHQESDASVPQASNWKDVQNRDTCGSCHDWIDWDGSEGNADLLHWGGLVFLDDADCATCHGPNATVLDGEYRVEVAHEIPEAVAAKAFEYQVVSVTNTAVGDNPTVQIRVLDPTHPDYATDPASTAYDINDVNGPFQEARSSLRVDIAWNNDDFGNLDPNDDLARSTDSGAPFQPIVIDFKTGATNIGGNVFEKTADVAQVIPSDVSGSGTAFLEGRPRVDLGDGFVSLSVAGAGLSFAIDDDSPVDRRTVVDINKCNDCHQTLALHGDNRADNTQLCATCHNANATDINRRVADSECGDELGLDDVSIDLKRMVHRIHAGNVGVCGYNNSAHDYNGVVYPGRLNNCEGCHLAGTYYPVDPGAVLATTVDAGPFDPLADPPVPPAADRSTLTDDIAISPNSAVCSSCHMDDLARNHMIQNGGDFNAGKDDTGALISTGNETCQLCHGEGASADTA
ncbi:MAG: OmcA/MtrC family decaheme c-type cytochrome, partial [Woeseiaceae bacterium]|nr:OmcA/MtrC family decaheme c-type cytochrome [Woeseiaceae bacterium]NNL64283.1 OmcA/MtrC family decaheme c-type cytochrome [Woeseiaceae bacterium]